LKKQLTSGVASDRDEKVVDKREELDKRLKNTFKVAARYDKKYI